MSFLKITDPNRRDQLVQELLNTRKSIKEDSYSSHLGKIRLQERYSKQLKPVTDKLESIPKSIANVLEPTFTSIAESQAANARALGELPTNISDAIWPQLPPTGFTPASSEFATPHATPLTIEDISSPDEAGLPAAARSLSKPQSSMLLGDIATFYTSLIGSGDKNDADTTFGLHTKPGQPGIFYIGDKQVQIAGDDLIIDDKRYEGTDGLWSLIVRPYPNKDVTEDDKSNYEEIMVTTNAIPRENDPAKPKSNRSHKYMNYIKPIWEKRYKTKKGSGARSSVRAVSKGPSGRASVIYLPSDPDALFDRLDLLFASKHAGNTGLRN